ncbi:uncharacterized protein [Palaemon carinicauda]|uniref:uncharacterized protein isoform X2 n=1 Tax=Palaemon carinicauda TaxID=392227 RepID=UPI0035B62B5A
MMSFIANAGAVPMGYVSAMIDSEDQCIACSEQQCSLNYNRQWQHLRNFNVFPPLPDLVLSNTPPPSPLRRAASLPFFPSGNSSGCHRDSRRMTSSTGTKTSYELSQPNCFVRTLDRNSSYHEIWERQGEGDEVAGAHGVWNSASHNPDLYHPGFQHRPDCQSSHSDLPRFLWEVPPCGRLRQDVRSGDSDSTTTENETSEERDFRSVGRDLRKIADRFQLDHGYEEKQTIPDAELGISRRLYKVSFRVRSMPNLVEID